MIHLPLLFIIYIFMLLYICLLVPTLVSAYTPGISDFVEIKFFPLSPYFQNWMPVMIHILSILSLLFQTFYQFASFKILHSLQNAQWCPTSVSSRSLFLFPVSLYIHLYFWFIVENQTGGRSLYRIFYWLVIFTLNIFLSLMGKALWAVGHKTSKHTKGRKCHVTSN